MKQIQNIDEIVGKTISHVHEDCEDQIWLGFSDQTFVILGIERGYYDSAYLRLIEKPPTLLENSQAVLKLGIATAEELRKLADEKQAANRLEQERREREQFERLAKKYGNGK